MSDELGFIEGQLQAHSVSAVRASRVARLANQNRWDAALLLLGSNQVASRILQRIKEMRHE